MEVSGDYTPDVAALNAAPILITTPEKWDGITRYVTTKAVSILGDLYITDCTLVLKANLC